MTNGEAKRRVFRALAAMLGDCHDNAWSHEGLATADVERMRVAKKQVREECVRRGRKERGDG